MPSYLCNGDGIVREGDGSERLATPRETADQRAKLGRYQTGIARPRVSG